MPRHLMMLVVAITMLAIASPATATDALADSLLTVIQQACLSGNHDQALVDTKHLKTHLGHNPESRPWQIADADRMLLSLSTVLAMPDSSRDRLATAHSLGARILDQYAEGDFEGALITVENQLRWRHSLLPVDHEDIAESLRRRAVLLLQLGRYATAAADNIQALEMLRRLLPADHPHIAKALHNLATIYRLMGDHGSAEPLYREALAMRRRVLDADDMDIVWSLNNLAIFLSVKGEFDEAEALFQQVLDLQRERLGNDDPNLALVMHNLANARLDAGRPDQAEPVFREALAMTRRHHGDENRYVAGILHGLGTALRDSRKTEEANTLLHEALGLYRKLLGDEHPNVAEVLADLGLLHWANHDSVGAEHMLEQAVETFELARLHVGRGYERSSFQATPSDDLAAVRLILGHGDAAWSATEQALGRSLGDLLSSSGSQSSPESLATIQSALDNKTALLGWLTVELERGVPLSWGYVVRNSGPVMWAQLDVDPEELQRAESFGRTLVSSGAWPFAVHDTDRLDDLARDVASTWIHPLLTFLDDVDRLVALPSEPLLGVPLSALPDPDGQTLDHRFAISYAPSASIYARLQRRDMPATATHKGALLVGDPPVCNQRLLPLPGARGEVQSLAGVFPTATILLGSDARETTLARLSRDGELASYRWLHLATHALVDVANPDRSSLVLAGRGGVAAPAAPDATPVRGDGLLTAAEIIEDWHLNADLVVLSGCRTALGRPTPGEGYIGLAHAFLRAGAHSLMVSLWPVDDQVTRMLMVHFYGILLGEGDVEQAEALRQSQRWLREWRDDSGEQPYRHPAYWSAFVLIGGG